MRVAVNMRNERGQALVEFALVLPIFCLLPFAILQLGVVFRDYITLTDAVRAGARKGAVARFETNPAGATVAAVKASGANLDQAKLGVTATSTWQRGSDVTVAATYPYSVNLLGIVVKSGSLSSTTRERVE